MEIVLLIAIGVTVVTLPILIHMAIQGRSQRSRALTERIQQLATLQGRAGGAAGEAVSAERMLFPTVDRFMAGKGYTQRLMEDLARSGWKIKPSEFLGGTIGAAGVGAILGLAITQSNIGALIGLLLGYMIPKTLLGITISRRKAALESQISEMIMLVTSALKSGYSFLKALQVAARELPPPICEMSQKVVDECQLGVPMEDALLRMAEQASSYDMDLVVSAVTIQSQVGGSLAEVLEAIGGTIRERVQIQGEVAALTAEGRLSGIVLMMLTPALAGFLAVSNPGYISLLITDPMGIKMIVGAVVLNVLGYLAIKKMMKVQI